MPSRGTLFLNAHLASEYPYKALGIRGCKLVPGSKNITPTSVEMYRIQEQHRVTYNMTIELKNIYLSDIHHSDSLSGLFQGESLLKTIPLIQGRFSMLS